MESSMSRRDELMAKSAGIRSIDEISVPEVKAEDHVPRSGQGSYARRQAMEERIAALEKFGGEVLQMTNIVQNPWQPRRVFNEEDIRKLADSIAEVGLIQPVVVRRVPNGDTQYQLIAGERRLRACRLLGLADIKALALDVADEDMAAMALAENMERQDLSAYEIAASIRGAESAFPNRKEMSKALGISRSDFYRYMAFFQLPDFILADLEVTPTLLGAHAAEDIVVSIKKHGDKATSVVSLLWARVKAGDLDQGKIAAAIESLVTRGDTVRTDRDIKKLFIGKEQAGSITRDASALTVKIRAAVLSNDKENRLREFVQKLLIE
jgi:ParB family chromosome partitioning protein